MSLLIFYQPEGYTGDPLFSDVAISESYEEVIGAACKMWSNYLPPEELIVGRHLARQVKRSDGNIVWARLSEPRFVELIRNGPPDVLELQLQIDCLANSNSYSRQSISSPSTLEIPPSIIHLDGLNSAVHHPMYEEPANELDKSANNSYNPQTTPLTPASSFKEHPSETPPSPASPVVTSRSCVKSGGNAAFENGLKVFLAGRYNDARVQFQSAVNQSHKVGDTRREADSLVRLGTTCRHLKDYAAARSHLSTARALYESLGDACRQEKFQCDRHLARVEEDSGNLQTALIAYQKLKSTTKKEGLLTQYGWCSYYLGHLYNQMERYEDALSNLKDATNISQHIGDAEIEAFATEDSGYAAERQGYLELAMDCYQKALKIFKTQGKGKWVENETRVKRRINQLKVRMENESWKASLSGLFRRQSTLK